MTASATTAAATTTTMAATTTTARLHGHDLHYLDAGSGPAVLFIHGLLGSHRNWTHLIDELADGRRLIAPDLFGHGASAKPVGDYSLSSHAATLRDLLDLLGIDRVTLVGHSLGGGIAMQFGYLFPERVERLVLVSSGGLGRELSPLLRAAALPGAELVLPVIASRWVCDRTRSIARLLAACRIRPSSDITQAWDGFVSLGQAETRRAFLATTRAVIDPGGQTVAASGHLPMRVPIPVLLVWGGRDRIIPAWHASAGQQGFPGSRVEIFERAGHFPHLDQPERFTALLREFIGDTRPS
jgi:pimeloyl-ACP methyl ester carboxylesterase